MLKIIERNFGIVLLIAGLVGYFFPIVFLPFKNFAAELLMFALFLGFLKIDFSEITHLKANWEKMIFWVIISLFLFPLFFYFISIPFDENLRMGLFLLAAISSAVMGPLIASILNLKIMWATVFVVLTSFLIPFSLPFLVKLGFGMVVEISPFSILLFLCKMVFIPAGLAFLFRRCGKTITEELKNNSGFLGTIGMVVFLGTVIADNQKQLSENLLSLFSLWALIAISLLFLARFCIGYFLPAKDIKEKLTNSLIFGNMNNGLAIILAAQFFAPQVLLVTLLSEIPWVLAQPIFSGFARKKLLNSKN